MSDFRKQQREHWREIAIRQRLTLAAIIGILLILILGILTVAAEAHKFEIEPQEPLYEYSQKVLAMTEGVGPDGR